MVRRKCFNCPFYNLGKQTNWTFNLPFGVLPLFRNEIFCYFNCELFQLNSQLSPFSARRKSLYFKFKCSRGEGSEDDSVTVEDNYNDDSEDSFVSEKTVNDESVLTRPGGYHRGHGNWTGKRIARSVGNGLNELQV